LTQADASLQFPIALLSDFNRRFGDPDAQLEVFIAIANKLRDESDAPLLLMYAQPPTFVYTAVSLAPATTDAVSVGT